MTDTTILEAPLWTAGQSQPEVNVNESINILEAAAVGVVTVNASADTDQVLSTSGATPQEWQHQHVILTDTSALWSGAHNVIVPTNAKDYLFTNNASTGFDATIKTSGGSGVTCPYGLTVFVRCDGTDIIQNNIQSSVTVDFASAVISGGTLDNPTITGYVETFVSVTSSGAVQFSCASANVFELTLEGDASVVFTDVASAAGEIVTTTIFVAQDGTGGHAMNVQGAIYASAAASTVSQEASALDIWTFASKDGGATWYGMAGGRHFA